MIDRVLVVIGILLAIPGVLSLLYTPYQVAAVITILTSSTLLVAAYAILYLQNIGKFTCKKSNIHLTIEDRDGVAATINKLYVLRVNHQHIDSVTFRNIACDENGDITNIRWNGSLVLAENIEQVCGEYYVTIKFNHPLPFWSTIEGTLSYDIRNSFSSDHEWLIYLPDFVTKEVDIHVTLPNDRPCSNASYCIGLGTNKTPSKEPSITNNGRDINISLKQPKMGNEHELHWIW